VETEATQPTPIGPGAILTKLREAQGYSQEKVSKMLHLPVRFIEAMDTDDYAKGPQLAFVKGYLRAYSRVLHISPNEIIEAFEQLNVTPPEPMVTSAALSKTFYEVSAMHSQIRRFVLLGLLAAGGVMFAYNQQSHYVSRYVETVVVPFLAQLQASDEILPEVPQTIPSFLAANQTEPTSVFLSETLQAFQSISAAERESIDAVQAVGDLTNLMMSFEMSCWVSIKDANQKRLLSGLMEPGKTIQLKGLAPFYVVLGNASAAKLWIDGKAMDISRYNENEVAKMKIAPDSLELSSGYSDTLSSLF